MYLDGEPVALGGDEALWVSPDGDPWITADLVYPGKRRQAGVEAPMMLVHACPPGRPAPPALRFEAVHPEILAGDSDAGAPPLQAGLPDAGPR